MNYVRKQDKRFRKFAASVAAVAVLTLAGAAVPARAQIFTVLYDAPANAGISNPAGQADAQGRNGNLYFTAASGGSQGAGALFEITPSGAATIIYSQGQGLSGGTTLGTDGNFYGTDYNGGTGGTGGAGCGFQGCGQVWKITPAGVETILYSFNGTDGAFPVSSVIEGTNGKYYGTTPDSGEGYGYSTAYSVTSSGTYTNLHYFLTTEGTNVYAGLVQGTDGNFYGTAYSGGANNLGTIFKMAPSGTLTVLHSFEGSDGNSPLCGTTSTGGAHNNGVVFKITPSGTYTVLHNLDVGAGDGEAPSAALIEGTDGNLYGVTGQGTAGFLGTIFNITTTGTFTTLYTFCTSGDCTDGVNPQTPLIQNTNGIFYGSTSTGGDSACSGEGIGCGTIFSLNMGLVPFVRLVTASGEEGAKIGILGQGFTSSSVVKFGGTEATTVTRSGTTYLTATVPSAALTGSVTVTTGSTRLTSSRTFDVTPMLASFSPSSGPVGQLVTINGTGLKQAAKVTFNGKSASFAVVSDIEITSTVPTGATTGKIKVMTKGGSVTSSTNFTVN